MRFWILLWIANLSLVAFAVPELERKAAEWRSLRRVPGHFNGGEWNADSDRWQGRKHVLMQWLAGHIPAGTSQKRLETLLGPPDAVEGERRLYYWRGRHDYLFFICRGGRVLAHDWFMAWE